MDQNSTTDTATIGGGCFWCVEAVFLEVRGVRRVVSGYAGGHVAHPAYKQVCGGDTGHAEVVQITFNPAVLSYADILRLFFASHDPTTLNRQGNDVGTQYRSIILTHDDTQRATAEHVMREIEDAKLWPGKLTTQIVPLDTFWPGEAEHQNYFARNPWSGYCAAIIAPKVAKFRKQFADRLRAAA